MRSIHRTALAVFAVALAFSAVAASAASATTWEWYTNKDASEWQQSGAKLSEAVATKSKGKVTIYDAKLKGGVECEGAGEGSAGPGAVDRQSTLALSGCVNSKIINSKGKELPNFCTKINKVEAVGLPWHTELAEVEGSLHDVIVSEGTKAPGVMFECIVTGTTRKDTCTAKTLNATVSNATGGVDATFDDEKLECSEDKAGNEEGMLISTQLVEATKGSALEANFVHGAFTKVATAVPVKGKGEVQVKDENLKGELIDGVQCEFESEGTVEAAGKGTITSFVPIKSTCKTLGECTALSAITDVNLPWKTEIYTSGLSIREHILSGGSGTPAWEFECTIAGVKFKETCDLNVSPRLTNLAGGEGVEAGFESEEAVGCGLGGQETARWAGGLAFTPTAAFVGLEVKEE
jgi:hypothetical protein